MKISRHRHSSQTCRETLWLPLAAVASPIRQQHAKNNLFLSHRRRHSSNHFQPPAANSQQDPPQTRNDTPPPPPSRPSLLPAGKRQARVLLPALFIRISATDVASNLENIDAAVAGGATAILITESISGGAAQVYEAAIAVKKVLRGRAALLIADRTDIANAADAEGVLLSAAGLPTVVAKGMLQDAGSLVGRAVQSSTEAVQAAADGASFVLLQPATEVDAAPDVATVQQARQQQRSGSSVPILVEINHTSEDPCPCSELVAAGVSGVSVSLSSLLVGGKGGAENVTEMTRNLKTVLLAREQSGSSGGDGEESEETASFTSSPVAQLSQLLNSSREEVVAAEKEVLGRLISFLEASCPALEESSLLRDAVAQLDELFLLVIVGEFNSGKSAVINALLGSRVLAEGILPTTNEISVLKWADDPSSSTGQGERTEQTADGLFVRYINADLLREVNVVDTPGTNVILGRQQRLTEEFVPRSDLVLFVMSADRPFTDSEVQFLRYIRQWGKKVVFVVNKCDLLASEAEVAEVEQFVAENAARLLGVDGAQIIPVSARLATEAKLAARGGDGTDNSNYNRSSTNALTLSEQMKLAQDGRWHASRFEILESFIRDFLLMGSSSSSSSSSDTSETSKGGVGVGESVRLKLTTPLFVAEALLEAAQSALEADAAVARADAASVGLVRAQLDTFKAGMRNEGKIQRDEVSRKLTGVAKRAAAVVDATLTLSNWGSLSRYITGGSSKNNGGSGGGGGGGKLLPVASLFRQEVPKDSAAAVAAVVREHSAWVASNCQRQVEAYRSFADARLSTLGRSFEEVEEVVEGDDLTQRDAAARKRWRQLRGIVTQTAAQTNEEDDDDINGVISTTSSSTTDSAAMTVASVYDPGATEALLESNVRDAVLSTASSAAGAGALGVLLTTVLPTTIEDLLALGLSAAVAYASVLNLPLRRSETKKKVEAATEAAAAAVEKRMEAELQLALKGCEAEVMVFIEPLEEMTVAAAEKAEAAVDEIKALAEEVAELQRRVANVE